MTTQAEVNEWRDAGKEAGHKYMIVVCDCFDYEDYPVYVNSVEEKDDEVAHYNSLAMSRVMEWMKL